MFWTPAFAGVTLQETFYEIINIVSNFVLRISDLRSLLFPKAGRFSSRPRFGE